MQAILHNGNRYRPQPITADTAILWTNWLIAQARHELAKMKASLSPAEYEHHARELEDEIASGAFAGEGWASLAAIKTPAGSLAHSAIVWGISTAVMEELFNKYPRQVLDLMNDILPTDEMIQDMTDGPNR